MIISAVGVGILWYYVLTRERVESPPVAVAVAEPPPALVVKTPQQIFKEADYLANVTVTWEGKTLKETYSIGSAFLIKFNGKPVLLTACHVVQRDGKKPKEIFVHFKNDFFCVATVDKTSEELDLAVLKIDGLGESFEGTIGSPHLEADFEVGDQVFSLGSPLAIENSLGVGNIINLSEGNSVTGVIFMNTIVHSAPIAHGSSGGPLVDRYGRVIGMTVQIDSDHHRFAFAVRITEILAWLAKNY